jgi:hypothetical protein
MEVEAASSRSPELRMWTTIIGITEGESQWSEVCVNFETKLIAVVVKKSPE